MYQYILGQFALTCRCATRHLHVILEAGKETAEGLLLMWGSTAAFTVGDLLRPTWVPHSTLPISPRIKNHIFPSHFPEISFENNCKFQHGPKRVNEVMRTEHAGTSVFPKHRPQPSLSSFTGF